MVPGQFPQTFNVSQNDVGRVLVAKLWDDSGSYNVPTGYTVKLQGTKPSGLGFTVAGVVDGTDKSKITFTATSDMTSEPGRFPVEIKVSNGSVVLGSANAYLDVEKNPHPDDTTDGSPEQLVNEITALVLRVEEAVAKEEVLHEAEAWAVGQRGGVDVSNTDPTWHNNSKYYKEEAARSAASAETDAQGAAGSASAAAGSASSAAAAKTAAEIAQGLAEDAAEAAASVYTVAGSVTFSVLENGQVRETWTEEE